MDVSIIITYYSGLNIMQNCLSQLVKSLNNTIYKYEIIIVNDNPEINLENHLKHFSTIKIINHEMNLGHPAACNTGAQKALGKFLVFMDCDIFVTEHWLENLLEVYKRIPDAGAVSSTILDMSTNKIHMTGVGIHQVDMLKLLRGSEVCKLSGDYANYDFLSSACIIIPKVIFQNVGGFDEIFFNSDGDLDLAYRIKLLGHQLVTSYTSLVYHKGRVAGTMRNLAVNDTKAMFFKKWGNQLPDGINQIQELYSGFAQKHCLKQNYLLINLSKSLFVKDYFKSIEKSLGINIIQVYNFKQYANREISLIDFLGENIANYNIPIVIFSDNYRVSHQLRVLL